MARTAPQQYRDQYLATRISDGTSSNVLTTSTYSAVAPVKWNLNLNRAARAHVTDRLTCLNSDGGYLQSGNILDHYIIAPMCSIILILIGLVDID
jgi:hypothetical protein